MKYEHSIHKKKQDHQQMNHSGNSNHGDHANHHEMMIKDFKKKFIISTILSISIIILSPLIQDIFKYTFTFPGDTYVLFLLS